MVPLIYLKKKEFHSFIGRKKDVLYYVMHIELELKNSRWTLSRSNVHETTTIGNNIMHTSTIQIPIGVGSGINTFIPGYA